LSRKELPELLSTYPASLQTQQIKERYLASSTTIEECIDVARKYPEMKVESEKRALGMVNTVENVNSFSFYFSKKDNYDALFKQCVIESSGNIAAKQSSMADIVACFPDHPKVDELRFQILAKITEAAEICDFVKKYPDFDKSRVIAMLNKSDKILTEYSDYHKISQCMGQYGNDFIAERLSKKSIGIKVLDLNGIFSGLNDKTKATINSKYNEYLVSSDYTLRHQSDSKVSNTDEITPALQDLRKFVEEFQNRPDYNGILKKAEQEYEYRNVKESGSISKISEYAQKYPEKFNEMDDLAYKNVSITSTSSINSYIRCFPNGKYVSIVMSRIPEAKAYEAQAAREAAQEAARREEERRNELCHTCRGNGNCIRCNGTRMTVCYTCGGTGIESGLFHADRRCTGSCKGSGRVACYECSTGRCSHCGGSGYQNR
jgi:hypothetical protein